MSETRLCPGPYLSSIIKWKPEKKDVWKEFSHTEESINHPVGQPLCVIFFVIAFNGFDAVNHKYIT